MRFMLRKLWQEESGLTSVEYAVLLALISIACMFAFWRLGILIRWIVVITNWIFRWAT